MMARRSVLQRTTNAGSTRSRNPGLCLSGAADARSRRPCDGRASNEQLIRREDGLALLFAPPFDKTTHDPGYIKGYPPGVRENGGQYTHAATWSVMAFAALGEGDKAAELFSLLNPINHSRTPADAYRYKVEPYVACADIYSTAPHVGRGGWTWYTGSAGWMQRAGVESILGLRFRGAFLSVDPCIPKGLGQVRGDGQISNRAILDFRREPRRGQSRRGLRRSRRCRDL